MSTVTPADLWAASQYARDAEELATAVRDLREWERQDFEYDARAAAALDARLDDAFGPVGGAR